MKHRIGFIGAGLAALLVLGTAASDEPVKIGVVDLDQAIISTQDGKKAKEELERKQREAKAKIQPMLDELKQLQEDLTSKKFVLSDDALYQKQLDLAEKRNKIDNEMKELEGQLQVDQQRLTGPLINKMAEVVAALGREQGFTLIVRRGTPGLLYTREALDITDQVIQRYNEKKS
jgi:outer membrane protein